MGWGDCGNDSQGRPIGYHFEAECDHPDCNKQIDRGLSYACGGMHGSDEWSCEKYFCEEHRTIMDLPPDETNFHGEDYIDVCFSCANLLEKYQEQYEDEDEDE